MAIPNFNPSSGGLATSRSDFQSHIIGTAFRHNANQIDISPSVTIDGYQYFTVADAVNAIAVGLSSGSFFLPGGDLGGTSTVQKVIGLQTYPIAATVPIQSAVPVYDTFANRYDIRPLTADDILPGFSITSFTGAQTVEIGASVTNPAFAATYSSTPTSAQITNTDGLDSPHPLSSPFTSATIAGTFTHNAETSVVFTLTAVSSSTRTATQNINFFPRMFDGVGTAGATNATASGTSAVLVGATGTLSSIGLLSSLGVGTLLSFSPSSQKLYVLATGGSHAFVDNSNNLPFPFLTPTPISFTNVNAQVVSMYIYESSNTLSGSFTLRVTA